MCPREYIQACLSDDPAQVKLARATWKHLARERMHPCARGITIHPSWTILFALILYFA